jgi:hypothetical protein
MEVAPLCAQPPRPSPAGPHEAKGDDLPERFNCISSAAAVAGGRVAVRFEEVW